MFGGFCDIKPRMASGYIIECFHGIFTNHFIITGLELNTTNIIETLPAAVVNKETVEDTLFPDIQ